MEGPLPEGEIKIVGGAAEGVAPLGLNLNWGLVTTADAVVYNLLSLPDL